MTKLDGTARGGILVALAAKFGLPVHFIGVGEGVDDLEPFAARDFAQLDHALRMLLRLIQGEIGTQLRLDLVVAGERLRVDGAELLRRLALGEGEVIDAVLGHESRGRGGDTRAGAGLLIGAAGHPWVSGPNIAQALA